MTKIATSTPKKVAANPSAKKVRTPVATKLSSKARSSSDSSGGSNPLVGVLQNQDIVVFVEEVLTSKTEKSIILISISDNRPDTTLGSTQGDHVTAYKSFLEMLAFAMDGKKIKGVPLYITNLAIAIMPDKKERFDKMLGILEAKANSVVTKEGQKIIIDALEKQKVDIALVQQAKDSFQSSRRAVFKEMVRLIGQTFIEEINLGEDTAFKKEGQADKSEGTRVKKAIYALKAIDTLLSINNDIDKTSESHQKKLDYFYEDFIKTGSPYKMGANAIFNSEKSDGSTNNDRVKKAAKGWESKDTKAKEKVLNDLYYNKGTNINEKIGGFFGNLFDFKFAKHENDIGQPGLLYKVAARHIVTMFHAFGNLQSLDKKARNEIINNFLEIEILENQGWKEYAVKGDNLDINRLRSEIEKYVDLEAFKIFSKDEIEKRKSVQPRTTQRGK